MHQKSNTDLTNTTDYMETYKFFMFSYSLC